jgi:hypothetical protein
MIVVVEGPSASGKTTWCRTHFPDQTVWEHSVSGSFEAPDREKDPKGAAEYWSEKNRARWRLALEMEARHGLAICDTDPFKLHYVWSLWQIRHGDHRDWEHEARINREMFAAGELGIADLFLVSLPDIETLRRQNAGDTSRRRGHFELHAQLTEPLREWYQAISTEDPARVVWSHPDGGLTIDQLALGVRDERTGTALFDRIIGALPGDSGSPEGGDRC